MALCSNCHNIVPRSITRCPVCGATPSAPQPELDRRTWVLTDEASTTRSAATQGISPEQFLAELEAPAGMPDPPDPQGAGEGEAESSAPWMPSASEPWMRGGEEPDPTSGVQLPPPPTTPDRSPSLPSAPADDVPGWAPPDGDQRIAPAPSPNPLLSGPVPPLPVAPDPDEERIRSVQAISSRIDADIRIGPTAHHRVLVSIVPAVAALIVAVTGLLSYRNPPVDRPTASAGGDELGADAVLAFNDPGLDETDRPVRAMSSSLVTMTVAGCGPTAEHIGIVVAPNRLITRASFVAYDVNPVVFLADGTSRIGAVIGVEPELDLAVIELQSDTATNGSSEPTTAPPIPWGSVDQLFSDPNVIVVEGHGATASGIATRQIAIDGIIGGIASFELDGTGFTPGAAVLNRRGLLVGVVDSSGSNATGGAELQRALGRLVLARPMATAACPSPEPQAAPEADTSDGTEDGG